jgi:hypothetical protein
MIDRFEIIAHGASRPDAEHVVFCDELFRDGADLASAPGVPCHNAPVSPGRDDRE